MTAVLRPEPIITQLYSSPCGTLVLGSFEDKLCLCNWQESKRNGRVMKRLQQELRTSVKSGTSAVLKLVRQELDEYFSGSRTSFSLPLLLCGTAFQKQVWQALMLIPYGATISYSQQAQRLGKPSAIRAVANANGANTISILVPCHRVIGKDCTLTGYAGGLPAKNYLIHLESETLNLQENRLYLSLTNSNT